MDRALSEVTTVAYGNALHILLLGCILADNSGDIIMCQWGPESSDRVASRSLTILGFTPIAVLLTTLAIHHRSSGFFLRHNNLSNSTRSLFLKLPKCPRAIRQPSECSHSRLRSTVPACNHPITVKKPLVVYWIAPNDFANVELLCSRSCAPEERFEDIQTSGIRKAYVRVDPTVLGRAYYRTSLLCHQEDLRCRWTPGHLLYARELHF